MREGRPGLAVPLDRGLVEEQPRGETPVRERFRCFGQTGDLPGLGRRMRALAAVLRAGNGDDMDPGKAPVAETPEFETTRVSDEMRAVVARSRVSRQ